MVHKFRGKPHVPITCLSLNDQILTADSQKAETLAQHYDNLSKSTNLDPTFQAAKTAQEKIFKICLPNIENERNNLNSQFTVFYGKPFYYLLCNVDILYVISDILYRI